MIQAIGINSVPKLRLIFLIQFLWGLSYFNFMVVLSSFLEQYGLTQIQSTITLWSFYIIGLVFTCFVGLMQDYLLGSKRSLYWGLILGFLGYLGIFFFDYFPFSHNLLYTFLAIIATAKAIISNAIYSLLGKIYPHNIEDVKMERFIAIDYIVSSFGALVGTFFAGIFIKILTAHITLFISLGMSTFSLLCLFMLNNFLYNIGNTKDFQPIYKKNRFYSLSIILGIILFGTIGLKFVSFIYPIVIVCVITSCTILFYTYLKSDTVTRTKLVFIMLILIELFVYYFFYHQSFSLIQLYIQKVIPSFHFLYWKINPKLYNIFNYIWLIFSGIILLFLHQKWEKKNKRISIFYQTPIAIILSLGSFVVLYISTFYISQEGFISLWWILGFYILQSTAEIIIAYIAICLFVKLMPPYLTSFGLGLRTTIVTLPALLFSIPGQIDALNLQPYNLQDFFNSQFFILLMIGLILYIPLVIAQPIMKFLYMRKSALLLKNNILEKTK